MIKLCLVSECRMVPVGTIYVVYITIKYGKTRRFWKIRVCRSLEVSTTSSW